MVGGLIKILNAYHIANWQVICICYLTTEAQANCMFFCFCFKLIWVFLVLFFNPLSANHIKWSNTLKQFVSNLAIFDHYDHECV